MLDNDRVFTLYNSGVDVIAPKRPASLVEHWRSKLLDCVHFMHFEYLFRNSNIYRKALRELVPTQAIQDLLLG